MANGALKLAGLLSLNYSARVENGRKPNWEGSCTLLSSLFVSAVYSVYPPSIANNSYAAVSG